MRKKIFALAWLLCTAGLAVMAQPSPDYHLPRLIQPESTQYDADDMNTYAVYADFHTVLNPLLTSAETTLCVGNHDYRNFCLWQEADRTCLAFVTRNDWNREYYGFDNTDYLEDEATGHHYMIKAIRGLPLNRQFMAQAPAGSFITLVLEFERIPDETTTIAFVEPPSEPIRAYGSYSGGYNRRGMTVAALKRNTSIMRYVKVKVVK